MSKQHHGTHPSIQPQGVYHTIVENLISALKSGQVPWKKSWKDLGFARSYFTNKPYQGINSLAANVSASEIPFFLTMEEVANIGGKVSHQEHAILIAVQSGKKVVGQWIYNIEDVEGVSLPIPSTPSNPRPIKTSEDFIDSIQNPPQITIGTRSPFYSVKKDLIGMPSLFDVPTPEEYYFGFFHQLVHSTGHASRLRRKGVLSSARFTSLRYDREDLIAEIGACLLCQKIGIMIPPLGETNKGRYLSNWKRFFMHNNAEVIEAIRLSVQAFHFLTG